MCVMCVCVVMCENVCVYVLNGVRIGTCVCVCEMWIDCCELIVVDWIVDFKAAWLRCVMMYDYVTLTVVVCLMVETPIRRMCRWLKDPSGGVCQVVESPIGTTGLCQMVESPIGSPCPCVPVSDG